jgi:CheY-like chemotaxis protein
VDSRPLHPQEASKPGRILVVDDEATVRLTVSSWLGSAGWNVVCAESPPEALRAAKDPGLVLAVVDYRFDNQDEGIRLGRALRRRWGIPFLLISGYLDTTVVVNAMKAGALDVVDKPLSAPRFLAVLDRAMKDASRFQSAVELTAPIPGQAEASASELRAATIRWSRLVLKACNAPVDPRTVPLWGHLVGVSAGTIEETCRLCDVKPIESRDLGRMLRAMAISRATSTAVRVHLDVADERTLDGLLDRAGLRWDSAEVSLRSFFASQKFVPVSRQCLRELAHLCANSPLFF